MVEEFYKIAKGIIFLIKASFIFMTEFVAYKCYYRNYSLFIEGVANRLAHINILYVKLFQAFALNNHLIDDETNNALIDFTDNAPWDYSDFYLMELVEIADKYSLTLKKGYEVPINSGMISLVFKAYNESGNPVIIKMKRRNIQKKLDDAIDNLLFSLSILSFMPVISKYKIADLVHKNIAIIRSQTNFLQEIYNMDKIRENCKRLKYIKIPKAVREVTEENPNFILMDYIEGIKINQIKPEDYEPFAKLVIKFGIVTTTIHGVTHGDLHCGNILFIKDPSDTRYPHKLGIIDFGIIYEVGGTYKGIMFDIFSNVMDMPPREMAEKVLNSDIIQPQGALKRLLPPVDYEELVEFTAYLANETIHKSKSADQLHIYAFLKKLNELLSREKLQKVGIRPSDDFIKSQLVLAMSHGVTMKLCNVDFITLMDKVINELFHTVHL